MQETTIKYFELGEFLESRTAKEKTIDNFPAWQHVQNLQELTEKLLDPLREAYGKPINVTSGFRCKRLNDAIKGSKYSAHLLGYAADLVPADGDIDGFIKFALGWLRENNIGFDQAVDETDKMGNHWLHLAIYNLEGKQRKQIFERVKQ